MIVSFQHKGLAAFYLSGSKKGIQPHHDAKLRRILTTLNEADGHAFVASVPGFRLHKLSADRSGYWSVWVNGNWRVVFRLVHRDVELVDYVDYH